MFAKNLFRKPIAVAAPVPEYFEYSSGAFTLLGYVVSVTYDNNTVQKYLFAHAEEKISLFDRKFAYNRAMKFYEQKFGEMRKQK